MQTVSLDYIIYSIGRLNPSDSSWVTCVSLIGKTMSSILYPKTKWIDYYDIVKVSNRHLIYTFIGIIFVAFGV